MAFQPGSYKAERIGARIVVELLTNPKTAGKPAITTLSHYLHDYFYPHIESCRAKATLVSYSNALSHFIRICGDMHLEEYSRQHFQKYKLHRYNTEEITKANTDRSIPLGNKAFNIIKILENLLRTKMRKYPGWYENIDRAECHVLQKQRGYGQYERRSIQDMFRKAMTEAGLPKELKFHCLRHSFATHLLEKGADIYAVSKIMGHSTPAVTSEFYDHTTALNYRHVADMM